MTTPDWEWDETRQVGTDFSDTRQVRIYDEKMAEFRDVNAENRDLLNLLQLPHGASLLEIGCGTGRFARFAASNELKVTAIDVSPAMLDYVREKAAEERLQDLRVLHAGFLTMDFPPATFDAALSNAALHHLPDSWKAVALRNIANVLKPGGQLLLGDVIFPTTNGEKPEASFQAFTESFKGMRAEAARHIATEYSTYDWIIEGLLERSGFSYRLIAHSGENFLLYHAVKK